MRTPAAVALLVAAAGVAIAAPQDAGKKPPTAGLVDLTSVQLEKGAKYEFRHTIRAKVHLDGKTSHADSQHVFTCTVVAHDPSSVTVLDVEFGPVSGSLALQGSPVVRFDSTKPDLGVEDAASRANALQITALAGVHSRITFGRSGRVDSMTEVYEALARAEVPESQRWARADRESAAVARLFQPVLTKPMKVGETLRSDHSALPTAMSDTSEWTRQLAAASRAAATVVLTSKTSTSFGSQVDESTTTTRVERPSGVALLRTVVEKSFAYDDRQRVVTSAELTVNTERVPPAPQPEPPPAPDKK